MQTCLGIDSVEIQNAILEKYYETFCAGTYLKNSFTSSSQNSEVELYKTRLLISE